MSDPKENTSIVVLGTDPKENTAFNNSPIVALWGIPHKGGQLHAQGKETRVPIG
jgi:hypothetical protein